MSLLQKKIEKMVSLPAVQAACRQADAATVELYVRLRVLGLEAPTAVWFTNNMVPRTMESDGRFQKELAAVQTWLSARPEVCLREVLPLCPKALGFVIGALARGGSPDALTPGVFAGCAVLQVAAQLLSKGKISEMWRTEDAETSEDAVSAEREGEGDIIEAISDRAPVTLATQTPREEPRAGVFGFSWGGGGKRR